MNTRRWTLAFPLIAACSDPTMELPDGGTLPMQDAGQAVVDAGVTPSPDCNSTVVSLNGGTTGDEIAGTVVVHSFIEWTGAPAVGRPVYVDSADGRLIGELDSAGCVTLSSDGLRAPVDVHVFDPEGRQHRSLFGMIGEVVSIPAGRIVGGPRVPQVDVSGTVAGLESVVTTGDETAIAIVRRNQFPAFGFKPDQRDGRRSGSILRESVAALGGPDGLDFRDFNLHGVLFDLDGIVAIAGPSVIGGLGIPAIAPTHFGFLDARFADFPDGDATNLAIDLAHPLDRMLEVDSTIIDGLGAIEVRLLVGVRLPSGWVPVIYDESIDINGEIENYAMPSFEGALTGGEYVAQLHVAIDSPLDLSFEVAATTEDRLQIELPGSYLLTSNRTPRHLPLQIAPGYEGMVHIELVGWEAYVRHKQNDLRVIFPTVPEGVTFDFTNLLEPVFTIDGWESSPSTELDLSASRRGGQVQRRAYGRDLVQW